MPQLNYNVILPLIVLCVWACALLLVDLFLKNKGMTALLAALGLGLTLGLTLSQIGYSATSFNQRRGRRGGRFSTFINALLLLRASEHRGGMRLPQANGSSSTQLMLWHRGMMLMAQASAFIVFLALGSRSAVRVGGLARQSIESRAKLLLGPSQEVRGVRARWSLARPVPEPAGSLRLRRRGQSLLLAVGAALILVGIAFKVAAVPFHMWTPDVYQGAPSAVTAFMASGAKIAGFAALLRVFVLAFPTVSADLTPILAVISALTMIVGNLLAISQTNIKRLLAYSSIAHAGYILMAFVPYGQAGCGNFGGAGLFYLVSYAINRRLQS
jgi:NADH-quinone oxidoreductase subunit N